VTPGRFGRKALVPFPLLASLLVGGGSAGWILLELSGSTVVATVAAAIVTWGAVFAARRLLAARGARESYEELPSVDWDEHSSGWRSLGGRLLALLAFLGGFGVAAGILSGLGVDGPQLAGLDPSEWLAFVLAAPLWLEVDARLGVRAARKRAEEEGRLRAAAGGGTAAAADGGRDTTRAQWKARARASRLDRRRMAGQTVELPAGGWRGWALALGILVGGVAGGAGIALDDGSGSWDRILGAALAVGAAVLGGLLLRTIVTAPYFLRLTPAGIDLMGAGEVPWRDVTGVEIRADSGLKILVVMLEPAVPRSEPWFTSRHRRLSRRLGEQGLSAALLFSSAPAEAVMASIRARSDLPVEVELDL
jgi:hypothetical protein